MRAAFPVLLATACATHVDGETPLTPEHHEVMAQILKQEPAATAMAVDVARHLTVGIVDEHGQPTTPEKLAVSMTASANWLRAEFAAGRIMEADLALFPTPDSIAQYDREKEEVKRDDRVVMINDTSLWSLNTVVHEVGHRFFLHDLFVTQAIREAGAELNAGFADAVITYRDYPYFLTALYFVPGDILRANQIVIEVALAKAKEIAETGDVAEASRQLKADLAMRSLDEAKEHIRDVYGNEDEMFQQFGGSIETVVNAYETSGMHEKLTELRTEAAAEFRKEYRYEFAYERKIL